MSSISSPPFSAEIIAAALVNPHRFAEVRRAIASHPEQVLAFRGPRWQESAMHWVAMSDPGSWVDLVAAGGDPNAQDKMGRTPLDWINDRLFMGAMAPHQRLGTPSRDRIRVATIKQVPAVWSAGGRPGHGPHTLNPVKLWIEAGLWDLLSLTASEPGMWKRWEGGMHALHAWVPLADRVGAEDLLSLILAAGVEIDEADVSGRSALWMAVDHWLNDPSHAAASRRAIELLRVRGADPDMDQGAGAPAFLAQQRGVSTELESSIYRALGM